MKDCTRMLSVELHLSRRALLRYGAAGLATAALTPLLQACGDSDNLVTNPQTGPAGPELAHFRDLRFENEVVALEFGEGLREPFILNGELRFTEAGILEGEVTVEFPDGSSGVSRFTEDTILIDYGGLQVDLVPDTLSEIRVNRCIVVEPSIDCIVSVQSVKDLFDREYDFTGIGPLSTLSRALLIPIALGSTPAWMDFMGELRRSEGALIGNLLEEVHRTEGALMAGLGGDLSPTLNQASVAITFGRIFRAVAKWTAAAFTFLWEKAKDIVKIVCPFCLLKPNFNVAIPGGYGIIRCSQVNVFCGLVGAKAAVDTIIRNTLEALAVPPQIRVLVDDNTTGFYNAALGTILDGTSELFPEPPSDPTIVPAPEPDLSPAAGILGDWLAANPLPLNSNWTGPQSIPTSWEVLTETAIIYRIDVGLSATQLTGNFSVDNGIFVWVNGRFAFGAIEPGPAPAFEYTNIDLGTVPPGINFIQILREDHGEESSYSTQISAPMP